MEETTMEAIIDRLNARRPQAGWTDDAIDAAIAAEGCTRGEITAGDRTRYADVHRDGRHIGTAWYHGESDSDDERGFDAQRME